MILEISSLLRKGIYDGDFGFDYTPAQDKMILPYCKVEGKVTVKGKYCVYDDDSVGVSLSVSYLLKGQCSYCLEPAEKQISFETEVLFVRDKDDIDNYYYDGVRLDLSEAVDDAFIFSQPDVLLCKEGCGGIGLN